jgi:short-subunit dehydrogenase
MGRVRAGTARMRAYRFAGGTAIVTGAGSGIGAALVAGLAARGSDVVLLDRDAGRLATVAATLRSAHPDRSVDTVLADLADTAAVRALGSELAERFPRATLLVNNAGIALTGRFDQVTLDEFDRVLDVNLRAAVALTHGLLPVLRHSPGSHLVNVSSIFGIVAPPGQAAYATSKFALRGFTEVLRAELHPEVGVTVVHPGGIATRIAEDAERGSGVPEGEADAERRLARRLLTIPPERAAAGILRGVERRRPRVLIGASAVLPDLVQRAAPTLLARALAAGNGTGRRRAAAENAAP